MMEVGESEGRDDGGGDKGRSWKGVGEEQLKWQEPEGEMVGNDEKHGRESWWRV